MQFLKCNRNQRVLHNPTDSFKIKKKDQRRGSIQSTSETSEKQLEGVL